MAGSRLGGIPELLDGGCGLTFTPGDPADLARTVVRFLRLPLVEREAFSAACRLRSRTFDRDRHVSEIESLYEALSSAPGTATPEPFLDPELLAILHQLGTEASSPTPATAPLQVLRAFARTLGFPKVLRDAPRA
jgi:hypothetical protein